MNNTSNQAYLMTRAAVMAGQLLDESDVVTLLHTPLAQLEKQFGLEGISDRGLSEAELNRAIERGLITTLMNELSILLRPAKGSARDILIYWSRKFELYNLKALIRGKLHDLPYEQIRESLHILPSLISLPHEQLLRTEDIPELLRQLEQTPYEGIANQARRVFEEKNEPFSLDATIDQRYYTGLLKHARACDIVDQPPLLRLIGSLIDRQNLPWLLRYRLNYKLSPTETYYLMVPSGRQLQPDLLKRLVNMQEIEQIVDALPASLKEQITEPATIMGIELAMAERMTHQARRCLMFSPSAVTRSLAYMMLRELDLKRVFAIIQGRVLKLNEQLIRQAADINPEVLSV
ncbi:MAG: V-type ATPase subunit [Sedimenticola sp.]|uniref:V-type ATPase subunit n=1 Tax=Sedimenticola thiotaurini TaxID=1543721 RepID=A0A558CMQ4_9GAMM|nr:V-type ATPase subunit [Sedimenticola sp.]MCW8949285.1 V-type ATPase subunit [Sedimenticola sp.]MCW8976234.1 V-type ATPase subunit [Sedimenticola sp.]TVT50056.1 MAG: V-type ATPase subunit [Sedimenticola thiotaurini]